MRSIISPVSANTLADVPGKVAEWENLKEKYKTAMKIAKGAKYELEPNLEALSFDALLQRYKAAMSELKAAVCELDPDVEALSYEALLPTEVKQNMRKLDTEMKDLDTMQKYVQKQINATKTVPGGIIPQQGKGPVRGGGAYLANGSGETNDVQQQ